MFQRAKLRMVTGNKYSKVSNCCTTLDWNNDELPNLYHRFFLPKNIADVSILGHAKVLGLT